MEWNVIVYDKPGADRSSSRSQHFAEIPAKVNAGTVISGGAVYQDEQKTKFAGSAFHLRANSREEVIEFLKSDIYYKLGVWDINSVIANPFGCAVRLPKKMEGVKAFE